MPIKKKILVVDDSETSLYLIRAIFEDNPALEIKLVKDSRQAQKLTKQFMPDLIILDVMMPGIDGFQLLDKIKNDNSIQHIPILMISAKHDSESIDKAIQQNADGYIKKPIIVDEIRKKVSSVLKLEVNN